VAGNLWPDEVLPVSDYCDKRIHSVYEAVQSHRSGTFDVNHIAHIFEGEVPYSQLLYFYRSGDLEHWRRAIRDAYYIADIAFDHSTETIRMLDLRRKLVRRNRIRDQTKEPDRELLRYLPFSRFARWTHTGKPTRATTEDGRKAIEYVVDRTVKSIQATLRKVSTHRRRRA